MQTTPQNPHQSIPAGAPRLFLKESLYGTFDRVSGLPVAGVREGQPRYALVPSLFADRQVADIALQALYWHYEGLDIEVTRLDPHPFTGGWRFAVRRAVLDLMATSDLVQAAA